MYWNALRVLVLMLGLMGPISGWAQQAGTSCTSGQNGYTGSADTGGNITKCNGSTWVAISGPSNTTVTASGTTGSVQYNSGGLLKGDSSLVWNSVSQTLGINTATPLSALDVRGRQTLDDGGNFELMANWYCNASVCDRYLNSGYAGRIEFNNTIGSWYFETVASGISNTTVPTSVKDMTITTGGLVGIGTTAPAYTLDMIGQQRVQTAGQSYSTQLSGNELFSKNSPLYFNASSTSPTIINGNGGSVGINNTTPAYQLDVNGAIRGNNVAMGGTLANFQASTPGAANGEISGYSFYGTFVTPTSDKAPRRAADILAGFSTANWGNEYLSFNVGQNGSANDAKAVGIERMRIAGNGSVGIGTSSPAGQLANSSVNNLDVGGIGENAGSLDWYMNSGGYVAAFANDSSSSRGVLVKANASSTGNVLEVEKGTAGTAGTSLFSVYGDGHAVLAGALTQNSDARLKNNIQQLPADVFEKLALIRGVTFSWKDKDRDPRQQIGVIAQDVQKAYPQLVSADASGTLSVNYNGLVAPLIEAVKQLKAENMELQRQAALDHDLLMKMRQHVLLRPEQITSYTEAAWHYGPMPSPLKH